MPDRTWLPAWLKSPHGIALLYLALGTLWLFASDLLLHALVDDVTLLHRAHLLTEGAFILATAGGLYVLVGWAQQALRRRDQSLRTRNQELEALVEAAPTAIFSMDLEGRITLWSPGAEETFGWSAEEALGHELPIVADDQHEEFEALLDRVRAGETITNYQTRRQRKDGTPLDVRISGAPLRDETGSVTGVMATVDDVSDEMEARRALERSRTHLATAQRLAQIGSWERNMQTGGLYWSDEMYRLMGWDPEEGITYERFIEAVHPEDRAEHRAAQKEAFAGDGLLDHTYRVIRADGNTRVFHERGRATFDDDGTLLRVAGAVVDITDRLDTERALRETHTYLQTVLDTTDYVFMLIDAEGTILLPNAKAQTLGRELIGRPMEPGDPVDEFTIPGTKDWFWAHFNRAVDGKPATTEISIDSPDGTRWYSVQFTPVTLEDEKAVLYSATDITSIRRAQQARAESEAQYHTLFNSIRDEILVCEITDDGFTIIEVNDAACEVLGYTRDELVGAPVQALSRSTAAEREQWKRRLRAEGEVVLESVHYAKDGTPIDVEIKSKLFSLEGQELTLSICRDIRDRKRMEEALRASRAEYRHLFESNPLPMWTYDLDTYEIVRVNEAAIRKYGYSEDEWQSMSIFDIRPESEHERLKANLAQPRQEAETSGPWIHQMNDGTQIEVDVYSHVLDYGERNSVLVLANDVTERNRAMRDNKQFNRELQTLLEVSRRLRQRFDSDKVLQAIVDGLVDTLPHAEAASLWLLDEHDPSQVAPVAWHGHDDSIMEHLQMSTDSSIIGLAMRKERSLRIPDVREEPAFEAVEGQAGTSLDALRAVLGTPLLVDGEPVGALMADSFETDAFVDRERGLIESLAAQAGLAIRNVRLVQRLRRLSRRLLDAQEQERQRLSRELHDEVGGLLSSLQMCLDMAATHAANDRTELLDELDEAMELTDTLNQEVRQMALNLRPSVLDDLGLAPALQSLVDRRWTTGPAIELYADLDAGQRLPAAVETAAYRIAQEALTNAVRHADAEQVQVVVNVQEEALEVHVMDDGCGFAAKQQATDGDSIGLASMRERADLIGGTLTVDSAPGEGTRVTARLPLPAQSKPSDA